MVDPEMSPFTYDEEAQKLPLCVKLDFFFGHFFVEESFMWENESFATGTTSIALEPEVLGVLMKKMPPPCTDHEMILRNIRGQFFLFVELVNCSLTQGPIITALTCTTSSFLPNFLL